MVVFLLREILFRMANASRCSGVCVCALVVVVVLVVVIVFVVVGLAVFVGTCLHRSLFVAIVVQNVVLYRCRCWLLSCGVVASCSCCFFVLLLFLLPLSSFIAVVGVSFIVVGHCCATE